MHPQALIGAELAGKYAIESLLGVGGFGAVYRATQAPLGRPVAVKVSLHPHRADLAARFVREARVLSALRHPGCVMLLDCGWTDGLFYLVQEFVSGRSLKALLDAEGPLAPARAVELTRQLLDALAAAHRVGVVHRDIKPANIMITGRADAHEEVRVLDFGIAKITDAGPDDEQLTATGMSLGTPAYMAPEQIRPGPIGPWTDVYAVGATLHHMLIGRPPFRGAAIDVLNHQLATPVPPLPAPLAPFDAVLARAMAKSTADRFADARAFQAALAPLATLELAVLPARGPHPGLGVPDDTLVSVARAPGAPVPGGPAPGKPPAASTPASANDEATTPDARPPRLARDGRAAAALAPTARTPTAVARDAQPAARSATARTPAAPAPAAGPPAALAPTARTPAPLTPAPLTPDARAPAEHPARAPAETAAPPLDRSWTASRRSPRIALLALAAGGAALAAVAALALVDADDDPGPDAAADAFAADAVPPDARAADAPAPDARAPDARAPDAALPDAALPDAALPDAALPDAALPDAAPPRDARPSPTPTPRNRADTLERRARRALDACDCDTARAAIDALTPLSAERARPLTARHRDDCQLFIPGNCRTRGR